MVSSAAGSGSTKISGNPAFFAYSNSFLIFAGSLGIVIVPPPMIVMPAASIFARIARVASGGSVRGTWTSLNVMRVTPSVLAISSVWSSENSRIEYDATPSFNVAGGLAANAVVAAPTKRPDAVQAPVAAAVARNSRREGWIVITTLLLAGGCQVADRTRQARAAATFATTRRAIAGVMFSPPPSHALPSRHADARPNADAPPRRPSPTVLNGPAPVR